MSNHPFQPKPFLDIAGAMVEHARASTDRITDFNVGAVTRTLLEASAIGVEEYYQALNAALLESIPIALFRAFEFEAAQAAIAIGKVRITLTGPLGTDYTIPTGLPLSTAGGEADFVTTEALTFTAGQTVGEVMAQATVAGVIGNVPTNTVTLLPSAPLNVASVTNPIAFAAGTEAETPDQIRVRFAKFIASLSRGTVAACEYAVSSVTLTDSEGNVTESVQRLATEESAGHAILWVFNGSGNTSTDLVAQAQKVIDGYYDSLDQINVPGYRPAGVNVDVRPMIETPVNLACTVGLLPGYAQSTIIENAVRDALHFVLATAKSGKILLASTLINAGLSVPGVVTFLLIDPLGSIDIDANQALLPGTFTLTWI
jgi:uncharacterized phage protein gp47/JayE